MSGRIRATVTKDSIQFAMAQEDELAFAGLLAELGAVVQPEWSPTIPFPQLGLSNWPPARPRTRAADHPDLIYLPSAGRIPEPTMIEGGGTHIWHANLAGPAIGLYRSVITPGFVTEGSLGFWPRDPYGRGRPTIDDAAVRLLFTKLQGRIRRTYARQPKGLIFAGPHALRLHGEGWHFPWQGNSGGECAWCRGEPAPSGDAQPPHQ